MSKPPRRRAAAFGTVTMTGLAFSTIASVTFAEPAAAAPPAPNFGPAIDAYQSYQGQTTCDPTAKPGVVDFRNLVLAEYPGTGDSGITRPCAQGGASEHKEGRAWDWGVSAATQRGTADDLLNWLLATDRHGNQHALVRRLGIMYIIWDARIWKAYEPSQGWQPYACSGVTDCHRDHVHFSFGWAGARRQTTWWTGPTTPPAGKTTPGFYRSSDQSWHLKDSLAGGASDHVFGFGSAGVVPVSGDWNADGKTTVGFYRPSDFTWHLKNTHGAGAADHVFTFGGPGMVPVTGDWDNDGKTTVGFYRPSDQTWHLKNTHSGGASDVTFSFGAAGAVPVTGDWNADGKTTVGFYRPADQSWHLKNVLAAGASDHVFSYGAAGVTPVTGDWNADGKTTVGFYRPGDRSWHVKNTHSGGASDHTFIYGGAGMTPVTGDWNNA